MEEEKIMRVLKEKAQIGDINARIALAINKIKYEGNIDEGIQELLLLAEKSEIACHQLIRMVKATRYKKYYDVTLESCNKFAKENNEIALVDLGAIYQLGILNEEKDINKAIAYFQKAIDKCQSGIACQSIGAIYYYGKDITQDLEKAYNYFKLGAKVHYADSEDALAQMYLHGEFVQQDYFMATYWYEKAFEHGKHIVALCLGNIYLPENNMLNDEEQALEWYYKGGCYHISECLIMQGQIYENSENVSHNPDEAIKCYQKASELGNATADFLLGLLYMEGKIVTKNNMIAQKYFEKALKEGNQDAIYYLKQLNSHMQVAKSFDSLTDSGVYLSQTTTSGMQKIQQEAEQKEMQKREKNREILKVAASINNSTGFIDDRLGYFIDENGNEIFVDADTGYIFNEDTGDISFYDKKYHTLYNTENNEITYLDIRDGYVYNFDTGKTTLISGNTTLGDS